MVRNKMSGSPVDVQFPGDEQEQPQASSSEAGGTGKGKTMLVMMEDMMKDTAMQKLLYPHLPEGLRNPKTFELMLSNPAYRSQLESMLEQQVCTASMCCTIPQPSCCIACQVYKHRFQVQIGAQ